jgi:glycosyltransferase involved in cell wall biosynthesis
VFPGIEDFGMVPVEAQAAGRPVIAYGRGGVLESVRGIPVREVRETDGERWREGTTGIFFDIPTGAALADAIACFESVEDRFDPPSIREWARRFDRPVFEANWKRVLGSEDTADRR